MWSTSLDLSNRDEADPYRTPLAQVVLARLGPEVGRDRNCYPARACERDHDRRLERDGAGRLGILRRRLMVNDASRLWPALTGLRVREHHIRRRLRRVEQ